MLKISQKLEYAIRAMIELAVRRPTGELVPAREIAAAATQRAEDDAKIVNDLQAQIAEFDKGETNAKDPCRIDDSFSAAARRLRAPVPRSHRPKVTKPAR